MNTVFARLAAFPILLAMSALMGCNKGTTPAPPPTTTTTTTTTSTTTTTMFPGQCVANSAPYIPDIYGSPPEYIDWVYQPCISTTTRVDILKGVLHRGTGDSAVFSGKNDFTPAEENQIFLALTSIDQDVLVKSGLHVIAPVWVFDGSVPNGTVVNSPNVIALYVTVLSADRVTDPNLGSKITALINQMASANKPSSTNANEPSSISASPDTSAKSGVFKVKAGASETRSSLRASGTRYVGNSPAEYRPLADILADPTIDWAQPGVNPTDTHAVKAVPRSLLEDSSNNTR